MWRSFCRAAYSFDDMRTAEALYLFALRLKSSACVWSRHAQASSSQKRAWACRASTMWQRSTSEWLPTTLQASESDGGGDRAIVFTRVIVHAEPRQQRTIERFAKSAGFQIVDWFRDPAVSGADPIETRPGFAILLNRIESNGVRVVLVEDASRFARDLMAQELGIAVLIKLGVRVLTANGDDLTNSDDPMKVAYRQMAGMFAQLEKSRLVAKLRAARDRKREATGRCEGRKSYADAMPATVALAKELHSAGLSYRKIAAALAARGHVTGSGKHHVASAVQKMLGR
jgi:DNA invertase Pin-like site-specific DNA recombinase